MRFSAFFTRFFLSYTLLMAALGILFGLLEIENTGSGVNTAVLFSLAYWCFYSYANKNARLIQGKEKWTLIALTLTADFITTLLLGLPTVLTMNIPIAYFFIGLAIILPLHLLLLLVVNFSANKHILKQRPELANENERS